MAEMRKTCKVCGDSFYREESQSFARFRSKETCSDDCAQIKREERRTCGENYNPYPEPQFGETVKTKGIL